MHSAPPDARSHLFHRIKFLLFISLIAFPLLLHTTGTTAHAQTITSDSAPPLTSSVAPSPSSKPVKKRVVALRRKEAAEGARLTLTSDAPLDDYISYAEGERLFVLVPSTTLAGAQSNAGGRGFIDMRVEIRGDDLLLSLRLQMGASVHVRQHFNRLDLSVNTNERANRN